jgi:hypothetical protein
MSCLVRSNPVLIPCRWLLQHDDVDGCKYVASKTKSGSMGAWGAISKLVSQNQSPLDIKELGKLCTPKHRVNVALAIQLMGSLPLSFISKCSLKFRRQLRKKSLLKPCCSHLVTSGNHYHTAHRQNVPSRPKTVFLMTNPCPFPPLVRAGTSRLPQAYQSVRFQHHPPSPP